jgi:hypothetical protein
MYNSSAPNAAEAFEGLIGLADTIHFCNIPALSESSYSVLRTEYTVLNNYSFLSQIVHLSESSVLPDGFLPPQLDCFILSPSASAPAIFLAILLQLRIRSPHGAYTVHAVYVSRAPTLWTATGWLMLEPCLQPFTSFFNFVSFNSLCFSLAKISFLRLTAQTAGPGILLILPISVELLQIPHPPFMLLSFAQHGGSWGGVPHYPTSNNLYKDREDPPRCREAIQESPVDDDLDCNRMLAHSCCTGPASEL